MATDKVSGPVPTGPRPRGSGGAEEAKKGELNLKTGKVAVTLHKDSQSMLTQASKTATPPPPPPPTQKPSGRVQGEKIQSAGGDDDSKTESAEEEEDPKAKKKKEEKKKGGIKKVEEAKKRQRRQQQEGFAATLERKAKMGLIKTMQDVQAALDEHYGADADITDRYDALVVGVEILSESDDKDISAAGKTVDATKTITFKENAADIIAGWTFGPGTDEATAYRERVIRYEKISDSFGAIMEKAGGNSKVFKKEVDKLLRMIKADMSADQSTMEPAHLKKIHDAFFIILICAQVSEDGGMLLRDMIDLYEIELMNEDKKPDSVLFAKKILELTESSWVEPEAFEEFVKIAQVKPGEQKVDFTQRFLALLKRLPEKVVSQEKLDKIIEAGKEYLESAIDEEEELLDEEEE